MALRDSLRQILSIKEPPRRIAVAFALGIFIGMSPLLGLHTVLGLAVAWVFRLNKFVTIAGVYITNPWTIVPIYTFGTLIGARLLGISDILPDIDWQDLDVLDVARELGPLLIPFVFGTTVLGLVSGMAGYIILYGALVRQRNARSL